MLRVPAGANPPYGTSKGIFKCRVGKNCMPLDPASFQRTRIQSGAIDWSAQPAYGVTLDHLEPIEIARARSILKSKNPEAELLRTSDVDFLTGLGAMRGGQLTHAGLVLFGTPRALYDFCPQSQVHYVHQTSETEAARNDQWRSGLLSTLDRMEQIFSGPANPEQELSVGFFKLRVPAFPLESIREAILNALTHRDYSDPGEVLIRHTGKEVRVTSPGGFYGGITLHNVLRHDPIPRNRALADILLRIRLVESAGMGRRRMWIPALRYGKPPPHYESDGPQVTLSLSNSGTNEAMARLVSRLNAEGKDLGMDALLILSHLRTHPYVDAEDAARVLQVTESSARDLLDELTAPAVGILERKSHTRSATFHLAKPLATELVGKAAYTRTKGLDSVRYAEMARAYLRDHRDITNMELRALLGLGESRTARVTASRLLAKWSGPDGFLATSGPSTHRTYRLRPTT